LSSPRRYMASEFSDFAAFVRSCIALLTVSDFLSDNASGSSCDEYCMNDNDLRKSNIFPRQRTKTDDDGVSEVLRVFDNDERIFKASSTRNCAAVSSNYMRGYNFRLVGSHRTGENRFFRSVGARCGFLRRLRECHLQSEVLLEVLVYPPRGHPPQPWPVVPVQQSTQGQLSN
jgi:hypothetical protein